MPKQRKPGTTHVPFGPDMFHPVMDENLTNRWASNTANGKFKLVADTPEDRQNYRDLLTRMGLTEPGDIELPAPKATKRREPDKKK